MYCIGSNLLSGIGQVTLRYSELLNCKFITYQDELPHNDKVFIFTLPIENVFNIINELKKRNNKVYGMTVCETETVHPDYGKLIDMFDKMAVPSEFCQKVLSRQFPSGTFKVIRHWLPEPSLNIKTNFLNIPGNPYIFYHIGNIQDPRKQVKRILEAFIRLQLPNSILLLKASCLKRTELKIPNIYVINEHLSNDQIEEIHHKCHCYVSFSNSEGVGMGAVEAAMHNKPVIISEYGGCSEYVKTPYTIKCGKKKIGFNDFLFTPNLEWGDPDFEQLKSFMKDAYEKKLKYMNHFETRNLMEKIKKEIKTFLN